jgi:hypothetical protein
MDMKTLMRNQIQEARKHKWLKGVETGRDPGREAINEWIERYASTYRKDHDECLAGLVEATLEKSSPRLREIDPSLNKGKMARMAEIILEEFTNIWFLEMTHPNHAHHLDEI